MDEQQTNQTTDTTNADAPQQEATGRMPGESSASADTSAALGASVASSDLSASVQLSAPAESTQQTLGSQEVGTTAVDPTDASVSSAPVASSDQSSGSISSDLGNASAASSSSDVGAAPVSPSSVAAVTGEDPNAGLSPAPHQWTPEQLAQIQAIGSAPIPQLDVALNVGNQSENVTQSSVSVAFQGVGTRAINASESLAKESLASLQRLRNHLWTFEHSAVAHLHAEIDKLESFFR